MTDRREECEEAPSLLDRESRGGDIAGGGFSFQESVMMSYVPAWLAHEGFEEMTWEAMGDIEAKFFVPSHPHARELVEVKNHRVPPTEFWQEIRRFRELYEGSPNTYCRFVLVAKELGEEVKRLKDGLDRVRGPHSFYIGTRIGEASFAGYAKMVEGMGHSEEDARFLFERVEILDGLTTVESQWKAVFHQELVRCFPEYEELSYPTVRAVYEGLGDLLRARRNRSVFRSKIEQILRDRIPEDRRPPVRPVVLRTLFDDAEEDGHGATNRPIRFEWKEFFGGERRNYPQTEDWDGRLLGDLRQTKEWILRHRSTRRIRLTGNRRLSASLAIGAVFSAVAGFAVEMENRGGEFWATDAYPTPDTPAFSPTVESDLFPGERLVVSVGVTRDISGEVEMCLGDLGLADMPTLHIYSAEPVLSPEHANKAARIIKDEITGALSRSGSDHIDLFFAGPSALALFVGHRLNATATVQTYEWVSRGEYVPTCELPR